MMSSKLSSAFNIWKFSCNIPIFLSLSHPAGLERNAHDKFSSVYIVILSFNPWSY